MTIEWPVDRSCLPPLPTVGVGQGEVTQEVYDTAEADQNAAVALAIQVLDALSARQFGLVETIVRPCRAAWHGGFPYRSPYLLGFEFGHWAYTPCDCVGECTVSGPRVIHLPGPVDDITEVSLSGVVLADDGYTLEGDVLYRVGEVWPYQNLSRPLGEPGTWSVTYDKGWPVPTGVDKLTGLLANEFMLACDGDAKCRIPRTVTQLSRRGVSHSFDPAKMLAEKRTGLPEIDLWLSAVNPNQLAQAPEVI